MKSARLSIVLVLALSASSFGSVTIAAAQPGALRPHIVYILSDDQGWKDVGFHGSDIKTPSIDRLAQSGVRLEQFYAQPMCTPSRGALMTGRYPDRYGLQTAVIPSAGKYGLSTDEWLLPQALKEAGYTTAIVGKWHLGHADRKYWPRQRGFDYQYRPLLGEIDYFTHSAHGTRDWFRNNQPVKEEGYVTQLLGKDAVKLIDGHDPKTPLFLYLTFTSGQTVNVYKRMGGTPDATVGWDDASGRFGSGMFYCYSGVNTTTALDATPVTATGASGMSDAPSATTVTDTAVRLLMGTIWTEKEAGSAPSGFGNYVEFQAADGEPFTNTVYVCDKTEATAGALDPAVFGGAVFIETIFA